MERFFLICDDPFFYRPNDPVRHHFGVNAEVIFPLEVRQHGIGNSADTQLQRRAVFNERGDVRTDLHFNVRVSASMRKSLKFFRALDNFIDMGNMDENVTKRAGHFIVHLSDNDLRALHSSLRCRTLHSETHKPVLIGGREMDKCNVQRDNAFSKQRWNFGKMDRDTVRTSVGDCCAVGRTNKKGIVSKVFVHSRL